MRCEGASLFACVFCSSTTPKDLSRTRRRQEVAAHRRRNRNAKKETTRTHFYSVSLSSSLLESKNTSNHRAATTCCWALAGMWLELQHTRATMTEHSTQSSLGLCLQGTTTTTPAAITRVSTTQEKKGIKPPAARHFFGYSTALTRSMR